MFRVVTRAVKNRCVVHAAATGAGARQLTARSGSIFPLSTPSTPTLPSTPGVASMQRSRSVLSADHETVCQFRARSGILGWCGWRRIWQSLGVEVSDDESLKVF